MDVVVTDKDGNPVTDLTPDDFEVRQDGKLQQVTLARYVPVECRNQADDAGLANACHGAPRRRRLVGGATPRERAADDRARRRRPRHRWENMEPTRKALRRFVAEQVRPGDLVALVRQASTRASRNSS